MNTIYKSIALLLTMSLSYGLSAQQLPVLNHYLYNPYLYNPARTGDNGIGSLNFNFKRQWTSMPYAPITGALSVEAAVPNTDMGVGAMFYSDRTHIINRVGGMGTYAYHIPFSKDYDHHLSAGMSLGFINQSFDFAAATVENENDDAILGDEARGTAFDFSFGLNYRWKDLNVGMSMMQGLNNQIRFLDALGEQANYVNTRHFMVNASYGFEFGETKDFYVEPNVMTRIIPGLPLQLEVNALMAWRKTFWLGLGYRSSNNETSTSAITTSLGVQLKERIFFAYTFEMGADATLNNALGTQHEVMIAYRFKKKDDGEIVNMRHEIEKLKEKDLFLEEKIVETNKRVDTLVQNSEAMAGQIADLEKTTADLKENGAMSKELKDKLAEHDALLQAQQEAITKNREDIDELRELVKKQPLKYKNLGTINFANASANLNAGEKSKLDALKDALKGKPDATIYLYGNASTDGDPNDNLMLSSKRCIAVRKYMVELGMSGDQIILLPMGQENTQEGTDQVNPNDRRVDIMLSED